MRIPINGTSTGGGAGRTTPVRGSFAIEPRGAYALAASQKFLRGFEPLKGTLREGDDRLRLAFALDGTFEPAGVSLVQDENGSLVGDVVGTGNVGAAERQTARILSLDVDGFGYDALGRRDKVIGRLQGDRPGFRPVCFYSPYEAAVHAILGQRISIAQAARLRDRIAEQAGNAVAIDGRRFWAFPSPDRLLDVRSVDGLPEVKLVRLHALAEAALSGRLDAERLRRLPSDEAMGQLRELPGVGPWSAAHILFRGAGLADALPTMEPRLLVGAALAYGRRRPFEPGALEELAEAWRPYRMWVSVLLVSSFGFSSAARSMSHESGVSHRGKSSTRSGHPRAR